MRASNLELLAFPVAITFAVVFALTINRALPTGVSPANSAEQTDPDYVMTVTARRLPAECRAAHAPAYCAPILAGDATVDMRVNAPAFAQHNDSRFKID